MPEHTFLPARRAFSTSTARRALAAQDTGLALAAAAFRELAAAVTVRVDEVSALKLPTIG